MKAIENSPSRQGFTLVELLVVITIIAMLAGMSLGALAKARERAKLDATKETVAKLNDLVVRRYESYRTRRVPLNLTGVNPADASFARLLAIRYLMLTEMPQCWADIQSPPGLTLPFTVYINGKPISPQPPPQTVQRPALSQRYLAIYNANKPGSADPNHQQAKCLYLWVMTTFPEAKSLFRSEEINMNLDGDKWPCFVDGWGNPIGFLRWAPGASAWSDIQIADADNHHDPFDPMLLENGMGSYAFSGKLGQSKCPNKAYELHPLIFAGVLGKTGGYDDYGIALGNGKISGDAKQVTPTLDPFNVPYNDSPALGATINGSGVPLVTNHHMEAR